MPWLLIDGMRKTLIEYRNWAKKNKKTKKPTREKLGKERQIGLGFQTAIPRRKRSIQKGNIILIKKRQINENLKDALLSARTISTWRSLCVYVCACWGACSGTRPTKLQIFLKFFVKMLNKPRFFLSDLWWTMRRITLQECGIVAPKG